MNRQIAQVLLQLVRQLRAGKPAMALVLLFAIVCAWMLGRAGVLLFADTVPVAQQGDHPFTWAAVFWFNALAVATIVAIPMLEKRSRQHQQAGGRHEQMHSKLQLLWTVVAIITLAILTEAGIAYSVLHQREHAQLGERTRLANQAFADHSAQIIEQVDILIRATRESYQRKTPAADLENFIQSLDFSRDIIENIFIIGADGFIIVPQADRARGRNATQRDYFQFHLEHPRDDLFISPVSVGQITGKHQFRLSRRLVDDQGQFAGVVLVPLEPKAFTRLYERLLPGENAMATLVSSTDRKIRARTPPVEDPKTYGTPIDNTPLWGMLEKSSQGDFPYVSTMDGMARHYVYQRIEDLPLVMVSGFAIDNIRTNTLQSIQPIGLGALLALMVVFSLAVVLTGAIRRRDEQESFTAMLAHELKTPLSVIRMAIGNAQLPAESKARINRSVHAMDAVIERCQIAERLNSGQIAVSRTAVDPNALLGNLREDTKTPGRIELGAPPLPICSTDFQLLRTVLTNLLDNALKYGPRAAIIRLGAEAETHKGRSGIRFIVSNPPGPAGFPDPEQVFRKYYRAPAAHGKTGSGLGLYIADELSRMLGGELSYCPTDDTVKFSLWIPL
jgi:signal transduction histidine kinase